MTNKTKIIIAILIILAIGVAIFGIANNNKSENSTNKKQDEIDNMLKYFDETDDKNTQINNTEIKNDIENITSNENQVNNENQNNVVVGKEEQESNSENTELDNKQKAIELAKKEWAISVNSYDFQVSDVKSDGTYDVTVISNDVNRTTVAIYNVNVKTEIVKDITE